MPLTPKTIATANQEDHYNLTRAATLLECMPDAPTCFGSRYVSGETAHLPLPQPNILPKAGSKS